MERDSTISKQPGDEHLFPDIQSMPATLPEVAGRRIVGDLDLVTQPRARDVVLLPGEALNDGDIIYPELQASPVQKGFTPRSKTDFFSTIRSTFIPQQESAPSIDPWIQEVYTLYDWYRNAFGVKFPNITFQTLSSSTSGREASLITEFHVDMPIPRFQNSVMLVKAYPPPGMEYISPKSDADSKDVTRLLKALAPKLQEKHRQRVLDGYLRNELALEIDLLVEQLNAKLDFSTLKSVPDYYAAVFNASYRWGLIHRSPTTDIRRVLVLIGGFSTGRLDR